MLNNNLIALIDFISNKLIYNFYIRDIFKLLANLFLKNLNYLRLIRRKKANNTIIFVNIINKYRYNNKYLYYLK